TIAFAILFASSIAGNAMNPTIVGAYQKGEHAHLQDLSVRVSRIGFLITLVAYAGVVAMAPTLMWLLGKDFSGGTMPLAILGASYVVRGAMSVSPSLLLLTGGERDAAWGLAGAALLNTLLNFILIPMGGVVGAAVATGISTVVLSLFYLVRAYQRTGI